MKGVKMKETIKDWIILIGIAFVTIGVIFGIPFGVIHACNTSCQELSDSGVYQRQTAYWQEVADISVESSCETYDYCIENNLND